MLKFEQVIYETDSLFKLIEMDSLSRVSYFESYIKDLKEKEKEAKRLADLEKINKAMQGSKF